MTQDEIVDAIMSPGGARSSWKLHYQLHRDERNRIDCAAKAEAKKLRLQDVCSLSLPPHGSLLRKFVTTQQEDAEANMQEMARERRQQLDDAIGRALLERFPDPVDSGLEDDKF